MPTPIRPKPKAKGDRNGYGLYAIAYRPGYLDRHNGATAPLDPLACTCPSPMLDEETGRCWKCGKTPTTTRRRRP